MPTFQLSNSTYSTPTEGMRRRSAGQQWQETMRQRQEAIYREQEEQRAAANRALRAQVEGLPSLTSINANLPTSAPQPFRDPKPKHSRRGQDEVQELEAQSISPPPYQQLGPLIPPTSTSKAPNKNSSEQIKRLQEEVTQKESEIRRLESIVAAERARRRRLQTERHEAIDAQLRADIELCRLKERVSNISQLLTDSITREKELESELDTARQEVSELKRQLHEQRCDYESEIRAQEIRERGIKQRVEDTYSALENEMRSDRHPDIQNGVSVVECEAHSQKFPDSFDKGVITDLISIDARPSRPRRQSKSSTSGRAFVSVPKNGNRRALFVLS